MDGYQAFFQHPLVQLGAGMMQGADPRGQGLGGVGYGVLNTGRLMRERAQLQEENERARAMQNMQLQAFRAKMAQPRQPDLAKSPTYIRNAQGDLEILQLSGTGVPYRVPLPEGYEPALPVTMQDVGAALYGYQRGATTPSVVIPKTLPPEARPETRGAQAAAVERAKTTEAAVAALPEVEDRSAQVLQNIDDLLTHPGFLAGTGFSAKVPALPGTDKYDFNVRVNQLAGSTFLQAAERMRGLGQLTEFEGQQARDAIARIDQAQSDKAFKDAIMEYRAIIEKGLQRARSRAGQDSDRGDLNDSEFELLQRLRREQGQLP